MLGHEMNANSTLIGLQRLSILRAPTRIKSHGISKQISKSRTGSSNTYNTLPYISENFIEKFWKSLSRTIIYFHRKRALPIPLTEDLITFLSLIYYDFLTNLNHKK
jgi:hypothetical protein